MGSSRIFSLSIILQNFRSGAPLQLTLSVCTPLTLLYMEIVYIIHNYSLLFPGNEEWDWDWYWIWDWYSKLGRFFFSVFSLKYSVYCLNTKDFLVLKQSDCFVPKFHTSFLFFFLCSVSWFHEFLNLLFFSLRFFSFWIIIWVHFVRMYSFRFRNL